jgi:hypothetical protein
MGDVFNIPIAIEQVDIAWGNLIFTPQTKDQ